MFSRFKLLLIRGNWKFTSVVDEIALAEEENSAAITSTKEEEVRWTDLKVQTEAAGEAAEITERELKEAAKQAKSKAATAKSTTFLLFLVVICTERCTIFNIVSNVYGYSYIAVKINSRARKFIHM